MLNPNPASDFNFDPLQKSFYLKCRKKTVFSLHFQHININISRIEKLIDKPKYTIVVELMGISTQATASS